MPIYVERILARAGTEPDAVVLQDPRRTLTAQELAELVWTLARALEEAGMRRGHRVAILATISPEALAVRYAAGLLGCAAVFCPSSGPEHLRSFLAHVEADALLVFPETVGAAREARTDELVRTTLSLGAVPGIDVDLLALAAVQPRDPVASRAEDDDLAILISSGGTTGESKASRRTFAACARMVDAGDTRDRRLLVCTPLAYVAQVLADQVLTGGGTVVLLDGFDPAEVLATIEAQRITHLGLVEPGLVELIDHPDLTRRDLSSVVAISHIGADAPANLRRRLLARAGSVLANPYGASEAGIISVLAPPEYSLEHPELLATAGRPLPAVEVRIERPDGSEARPGEPGAIVIRSAAAADGYDIDPTRSSFGDHYRTGDLGFLDADGYLHVRGRLKDARTIEGETVMPIDVANALCAHPDVRYAVAVPTGADDGGFGAVVSLAPDTATTAANLEAFVAEEGGSRVVPEVIVLVDRIPATEQGKPDRAVLTGLLERAVV